MTNVQMPRNSGSTSAAGAMLRVPVRDAFIVGVMLAELGTSPQVALPTEVVIRSHRVEQTTAGASVPRAHAAGPHIAELRRISGLTWDQLARLFKASRRSLHFWASGRAMTPSNEEHLQRLLAVVRKMDRGSASANRAALLAVNDEGAIPFDLLAAADYERVVALLGPGEARRVRPPKLSHEAVATRAPRPPDELVGALQNRVHRETGIARPAKSVRIRSGG